MDDYKIKQLPHDEFMLLWKKLSKEIFSEEQIFPVMNLMSESEKGDFKKLKENMGAPIELNFCVFKGDELVGWTWGMQETAEVFYMCNSAILPGHRLKGLYTKLINKMVEKVMGLGFQRIYSRHNLTNNRVIIPKLKNGFTITSMEVSDRFGSMVHLTYYKNKIRNKMMDYRVGLIKPDEEIKKLLEFD